VPVDHANPRGRFGSLDVFVREVVPASKDDDKTLPCLLYLQGGPGFPSGRPTSPPSGWTKAALGKGFRVFLLDQRGTGRSTPATAQSLSAMGSAADQAEYLTHFRADSIVRDCEVVRSKICKAEKLTLLGQSFGGASPMLPTRASTSTGRSLGRTRTCRSGARVRVTLWMRRLLYPLVPLPLP
jgi:pimeloyl-ACP methyl ester carboxylesterase